MIKKIKTQISKWLINKLIITNTYKFKCEYCHKHNTWHLDVPCYSCEKLCKDYMELRKKFIDKGFADKKINNG